MSDPMGSKWLSRVASFQLGIGSHACIHALCAALASGSSTASWGDTDPPLHVPLHGEPVPHTWGLQDLGL